jgi:hypothetical protein
VKAAVIIDTNVPVVANGKDTHASVECQLKASARLKQAHDKEIILLDSLNLIFAEYKGHLSFSGQPGLGDAFFKHLYNNIANVEAVVRVEITELGSGWRLFSEVPDDPRLETFDRDDQKFVAVAMASEHNKRTIVNAVDNDDWEPIRVVLTENGIDLEHVCVQQRTRGV